MMRGKLEGLIFFRSNANRMAAATHSNASVQIRKCSNASAANTTILASRNMNFAGRWVSRQQFVSPILIARAASPAGIDP